MTKNLSILLYVKINLHIQRVIIHTKVEMATKTWRDQE